MGFSQRGDSGSIHVLETVIVAAIMVSAVAYVATFEAPAKPPGPARANLEQVAQDALTVLYDTPVTDSSLGDNALSVYLAQCMQGDCDELTGKLDRIVPQGAKYAVFVSNGYETFPVFLENQPAGEAVTATQLLEPQWSSTFTSSGVTNVNPTSDALLAYALPIFNSNVVTPGGSPLKVLVEGVRASDGANYTITGFYTTVAVDSTRASLSPAVSFTFLADAGNASAPAAVRDVRATTVDGAGLPTGEPVAFTLKVREEAGVPLVAGTEITVNLPRGWTGTANYTRVNAHWLVLENATDASASREGSSIKARLRESLTNDALYFSFDAVYHGDVLSRYPFQAVLSKGAGSEASMLVHADNASAADEPFAVPAVAMSVPRPMGATATTDWTLVVEIPYRASEDVALSKDAYTGAGAALVPTLGESDPTVTHVKSSVRVERIRIVEEDGAGIFGSIAPVSGSGTWAKSAEGDSLVWTGEHDMADGPLALTFRVTGSGVAGAPETRPGLVPPVEFDGWSGRILPQVAPGFFRGSFLPDSADHEGYTVTGAVGEGVEHTFRSDSVYRSTSLPGSATYTINPVAPFQDSIYGSYVAVDDRTVPVGGTAVVTADVQSLLFALSQAGQSAGITVRFYPPWSGDDRTPVWEQGNLDQGILTGDVTQLALLDLNDDGYLDPIVGTDNGRVFGYNGLTGARIQGDAFLAPIRPGSQVSTSPSISHLGTFTIDGVDYLVVGTDKQSGIFVLDKDMDVKWSWMKPNVDTVSLDASVDISGDGRDDIVVALSNYAIYVLTVPAAEAEDPVTLVPYQAPGSAVTVPDAFYVSVGEATALVGLEKVGPKNERSGFAVTFQSVPGVAGVREEDPVESLSQAKPITSLPRAGLRGIDSAGAERWTFFGSPVEIARAYDYDGDAMTDIVGGSPAGYVYMMNGKAPTQPLYSSVVFGTQKIIDGDATDAANAAFLTDDGTIVYTYDGWNTWLCPYCVEGAQLESFPTANAIAVNGSSSYWLAGNLSSLWRSVALPADPTYVELADVYPINITESGILDTEYFLTHPHSFYDVTFLSGANAGAGWVVGDTCLVTCTESIVLHTVDGGQTWTKASLAGSTLVGKDGLAVTSTLRRVNFTTTQVGWIAGDGGTLLRSVDGGVAWKGLQLPFVEAVSDISCAPEDPDTCILVAANGKAYKSTNALDGTALGAPLPAAPTWAEVATLGIGATGRPLYSVGLVDRDTAYIGAANMVLRTENGGVNWTTLPMNYLENDAYRVSAFADGSGYIFGGSLANGRFFYLADYELESRAQTLSLTPGLSTQARITNVEMEAVYLPYEDPTGPSDALATFYASTDGGVSWSEMLATGEPVIETGTNAGSLWAYPRWTFEESFVAATSGSDLRFRADFSVAGTASLYTPRVRDIRFEVTYVEGGVQSTLPVTLDLSSAALRDPNEDTAAWDVRVRELRAPIIDEYWTRNVSGEVRDVQTGYDVEGDSRHDVWVATGGVLAGNSPDHTIYAGTDESRYTSADNRIYLLDGATGVIVRQTDPFVGNVTHLRLANIDADPEPEYLYATIWQPGSAEGSGPQGYLAALDPKWLTVMWMTGLGHVAPADLEAIRSQGGESMGVVAMRSVDSAGGQVEPGKVWALRSDAKVLWSVMPHEQGFYLVVKQIPRNWFFGAYVVEVEVSWTDQVTESIDGVQTARSVFQAARFYDYFLVTPPDALSPPSPVYNVHLVMWYPDWE